MARKGSRDVISRQNIRLVNNKPLIFYIIKTALEFSKAEVYVSTDSDEIKELSLMYGAKVIHRPKSLTTNSTSIKEICFHALKDLQRRGKNFEKCLVLHPKIPLIKLSTIRKFLNSVEKNVDTVFGVYDVINSKLSYNVRNSNDLLELNPMKHETALLNRIVSFRTKKFLKNNGKFDPPFKGIRLSKNETLSLTSYHDFGIFEQIITRKRILVRIDSTVSIGMGHVYNMLTILNNFRNEEIIIVMHKNRNLGSNKFKEHLYDVKNFSTFLELEKIIEDFHPNIIFNDILNTDENYMKKLTKFNSMIVNFEDVGKGRKYTNLVFNPIFNKRKQLSKEFYGGKYACVREEFRIWKNTLLRKKVEKVIISFGGTDLKNITKKTLLLIEKNQLTDIEFTVILGFGFRNKNKIRKLVKKLQKNNLKIILVESSDFLAQYIRDTDFAIISNGRTVFEVACMNVPIITVAINNREKSHSFVKEEKIGLHIDFKPSSFNHKLISKINQMLIYKNRSQFKKNLKKLELLNGVNTVTKKINSEFESFQN